MVISYSNNDSYKHNAELQKDLYHSHRFRGKHTKLIYTTSAFSSLAPSANHLQIYQRILSRQKSNEMYVITSGGRSLTQQICLYGGGGRGVFIVNIRHPMWRIPIYIASDGLSLSKHGWKRAVRRALPVFREWKTITSNMYRYKAHRVFYIYFIQHDS